MGKNKKPLWKNAILEVLDKQGGATTLAVFYSEVPKLISHSTAIDYKHNIRGYITRLKNQNYIKQIGLCTYALKSYKPNNEVFYEEVLNERMTNQDFMSLPDSKMHGYLQGMLVEIGNLKELDTYTPDKNVVFNGKILSDVATCRAIPEFTYSDRLKKIAQIDVIWFNEGYPVKTFDIEHSTDFTKALVRSYQLKYFQTECFMVADEKKQKIFEDRITTSPFNEIKNDIKLLPNSSVFQDYQNMLRITKLKKQSFIL